jgi:hypothetical protein
LGGEVIKEKCPNCGYVLGIFPLLRASKSRFLQCPWCGRIFRGLSDVSVLDGVGIISTRHDLKGRSRDYLSYACRQLNLSKETEETAWTVLERFNKDWGTRAAVAGALYIACLLSGEHRSQSEIAFVLKVTEVTVRKRYGEISKRLDIDRRKIRLKRVREDFLQYCSNHAIRSTVRSASRVEGHRWMSARTRR